PSELDSSWRADSSLAVPQPKAVAAVTAVAARARVARRARRRDTGFLCGNGDWERPASIIADQATASAAPRTGLRWPLPRSRPPPPWPPTVRGPPTGGR